LQRPKPKESKSDLKESALDLESKVKLGQKINDNLPDKFKRENKGKFIAITFDGHLLALGETLESLNQRLASMSAELHENYYIGRIGFTSTAEIG